MFIQAKKFKIFVASILLVGNLLFCNPVHAGAWGESLAAATLKQALETAYKSFMDAMVASLKIQANKLIMDRLSLLLTGQKTGGSPMFITNYNNFIYFNAQAKVNSIMNSFFTSINSGVSSATQSMLNNVSNSLNQEIFYGMYGAKSTIDEYVYGGLDYVFDETQGGGSDAYMQAVANPFNNPYGTHIYSYAYAREQMVQQQEAAKTEAIAGQGFKSSTNDNNLINLPGSIMQSLTSQAQGLYMQMLAFAQSIPSVVGTMAAQTLSQMIASGIAKVTDPIDNQIKSFGSLYGSMRDLQSTIYKGVQFSN